MFVAVWVFLLRGAALLGLEVRMASTSLSCQTLHCHVRLGPFPQETFAQEVKAEPHWPQAAAFLLPAGEPRAAVAVPSWRRFRFVLQGVHTRELFKKELSISNSWLPVCSAGGSKVGLCLRTCNRKWEDQGPGCDEWPRELLRHLQAVKEKARAGWEGLQDSHRAVFKSSFV